jgi:hypothetical protein
MLQSLNNKSVVVDTAKLVGDMLSKPKTNQTGKMNKNRKKKQKRVEKKLMREIIETSIIKQRCTEAKSFSECQSQESAGEE